MYIYNADIQQIVVFVKFGNSALTRDNINVKDAMMDPSKISNNNNCI